MKEDCETGKVVQKPCLFMQQSRSEQLDSCSVFDCRAIKSRTCATKSQDKSAGVTLVLVNSDIFITTITYFQPFYKTTSVRQHP